MIESVGYDFDDVLVSTRPALVHKLQATARRMRLEVPSAEAIDNCYDYVDRMIRKLFPGADAKEFLDIYNTIDAEYRLVDGALYALKALENRQQWIFTGRPKAKVERRAEQAGLDLRYFCAIVTCEDSHPYRKPDELTFDACAWKLNEAGVDASRSVYVDDMVANYLVARERKMGALLLLGSPNSRGYEGVVDADDVLLSMRDLPNLVAKREASNPEVV